MIAIAAMLALIIGNNPLPKLTPMARTTIAKDLWASSDNDQIRSSAGLVIRKGRVLSVGSLSFVDEGACDQHEGCERYRMDRLWPGNIAGVRMTGWEESEYYLAFQSGWAVPIGERPFFSPNGKLFFVGLLNEMNDESSAGVPNGITLWAVDAPGVGFARIRTVNVAAVAFTIFTAWHGNDCVEFKGMQGYGVFNVEKSFWLKKDSPEWSLTDQRPAGCD